MPGNPPDSGINLGQWPGYFEHTEMEMMVQAGLNADAGAVAATGGAARVWRLEQQLARYSPATGRLAGAECESAVDIRNTRRSTRSGSAGAS